MLFTKFYYFRVCFTDNFVGNNNNYPLKVLQEKQDQDKNVIFSPLSISACVGMLYLGSKGNTKDQIKRALFNHASDQELLTLAENLKGLFNVRSKAFNISLANRAYVQRSSPLLESYTNALTTKFSSDIVAVDFNDQTAEQINQWVSEKTNDKIKDLLPARSVGSSTRLVLVNALYLKADWEYKFDPQLTSPKVFYSTPTKNVTVNMMNAYRKYHMYKENSDVQVLGIPFRKLETGPELFMVFVLPKDRFGLKRYESKLNNIGQFNELFQQTNQVEIKEVMKVLDFSSIHITLSIFSH